MLLLFWGGAIGMALSTGSLFLEHFHHPNHTPAHLFNYSVSQQLVYIYIIGKPCKNTTVLAFLHYNFSYGEINFHFPYINFFAQNSLNNFFKIIWTTLFYTRVLKTTGETDILHEGYEDIEPSDSAFENKLNSSLTTRADRHDISLSIPRRREKTREKTRAARERGPRICCLSFSWSIFMPCTRRNAYRPMCRYIAWESAS